MGKLRDDEAKKIEVKDKTKALYSQLLDLEEDYALELIDWYIKQTTTNRKHIEETELRARKKVLSTKLDAESQKELREVNKKIKAVLPSNYPSDLKNGDIVWVNYGQGYAGEISDGHYGIIIARKGSNFFVAPLTKTRQPDNENTFVLNDLNIPAKGGAPVKTGYVNFGQMKFVHYRRLENIIGLSTRKNVADKLPDLLAKFNNIIS